MARSRGDVDLIEAIYDASIDPSSWAEVVKCIVEATKSVSGTLHIKHTDAAHPSATCNINPFYVDAYIETWHKHNPILPIAATMLPGELRTFTSIIRTDTFRSLGLFQ